MKPSIKHCAVYTRKSTEEGLEQDFNTLDAQREAGLSYIASQKAEGWLPVPDAYDDGGFSGGTLDRPALKRLMEDIKAGKVHIVVVYKIDRLTRALMDFSKLVEVFDQYGVTFVSITQSFNTTTSMGRLTLNVLLSFAQFEREVIGERVRDKIAASKKKGMWMGGKTPLGYDIQQRKLVPNALEAKTVNYIFERYLVLNNVMHLKQELDQRGIVSKVLTQKNGQKYGGKPLSRGALYALLSNPIYNGQIRHKNKTYEGQHVGIVRADLWSAVQEKLQRNASIHIGHKISKEINLLKGLLFDVHGTPYSPSYTTKGKKQYRYYISQNLIQMRNHPDGLTGRFPAHEIESVIESSIRKHLITREAAAELFNLDKQDNAEILQAIVEHQQYITMEQLVGDCIEHVKIDTEKLEIQVNVNKLAELTYTLTKMKIYELQDCIKTISAPYSIRRVKKGALAIAPEKYGCDIFDLPPDQLKKLVQGFIWRNEHFEGLAIKNIALREKYSQSYVATAIFSTFEILKAA